MTSGLVALKKASSIFINDGAMIEKKIKEYERSRESSKSSVSSLAMDYMKSLSVGEEEISLLDQYDWSEIGEMSGGCLGLKARNTLNHNGTTSSHTCDAPNSGTSTPVNQEREPITTFSLPNTKQVECPGKKVKAKTRRIKGQSQLTPEVDGSRETIKPDGSSLSANDLSPVSPCPKHCSLNINSRSSPTQLTEPDDANSNAPVNETCRVDNKCVLKSDPRKKNRSNPKTFYTYPNSFFSGCPCSNAHNGDGSLVSPENDHSQPMLELSRMVCHNQNKPSFMSPEDKMMSCDVSPTTTYPQHTHNPDTGSCDQGKLPRQTENLVDKSPRHMTKTSSSKGHSRYFKKQPPDFRVPPSNKFRSVLPPIQEATRHFSEAEPSMKTGAALGQSSNLGINACDSQEVLSLDPSKHSPQNFNEKNVQAPKVLPSRHSPAPAEDSIQAANCIDESQDVQNKVDPQPFYVENPVTPQQKLYNYFREQVEKCQPESQS